MGFSLGDLNPVKAVDKALVGLDKSVKDVGGWKVVGPAAAALVAAPYLLPELGAAGASSGFGINAALPAAGSTFGTINAALPVAGATFGELTGPSIASMVAGSGLGLNAAGATGLSALQKAMLLRSGIGALGQMTGGSQIGGGSGGGGGAGSNYNYTNYPYLANPQQNTIQMKTGRDVSGTGTTTAGLPIGLDTSRQAALLANLLRG